MCGRLALTSSPELCRAFFGYVEQPNFPPRYNIAPTQAVPILTLKRLPMGGHQRHFTLVRWGFLPAFVKDPKDFPLVINARSESVAEKASFKNALRHRRCIFIADAFYEWRRPAAGAAKGGKGAQPYLFRRKDGAPLALAGLWETWMGPDGEEMDTACLVTTQANETMAPIHDRMPVILEPEDFDSWLNVDGNVTEASALMRPAAASILDHYAISPAVNKVANDDASVQLPYEAPLEEETSSAAPSKAKAKRTSQAELKARQGNLF
jgi:putative SOS response-associated peptidase YedK